VKHSMETS